MQEERKPFYYLDKLVNILLVDDSPEILTFLSKTIAPIGAYTIHKADNSKKADEILSSPTRIHMCIMDLGLTDIMDDQFYLLKKYGARISFLIFTGRQSPYMGFESHILGAKNLLEKSAEFDSIKFLKNINYLALLNIINPKYDSITNDSLSASTDILFEKTPLFVSNWAQSLGMTDRTLRHIWTKNLGANAKIILSIFQMFETAFSYSIKLQMDNFNTYSGSVAQSSTYKRLEEFFHLHKSTITDFISFGNVAALL